MVYQTHYPNRSMTTARGAKRAPMHHRLEAHGAYFKDVSGWEGADWYAGEGQQPDPGPLTFGRPSFWPLWQAEHEATRHGVIVMDMSFMARFLVQGRDAGRVLNWISANDVDAESGRVTYTQWLNAGGTIEGDLTVTKLEDEKYLVVASDTAHRHTATWLKRHTPDDAHCFTTDVTSAFAQLTVQGPRSRELMQLCTTADMSNDAFPFRCAQEIDIGFARVLVIRITYLGELGYELYIPAEHAVQVHDLLVEQGRKVGLKHAGLKALASLRMEKGYRDYGHDIDNLDSPLEVGLGFAVDLKKPGGFLGKDAVLAKKAEGPLKRRLLQVLVRDPEPLMYHAEIVYRDGKAVGNIRAASYGFTLGGAVGLAMVHADEPMTEQWLKDGVWEVDIAGTRYPALASLKPLYDPEMARIKR
jgi:4-methylaminobutanoate oxidase (formaldehyde-forming)